MPEEPDIKRAVSFIDGQNLFRHAKDAFGHYHPNYGPRKLSDAVCEAHGWINHGVRFYTGVPSADRAPMWHGYPCNLAMDYDLTTGCFRSVDYVPAHESAA